jgi:hypothetical protein
MMFKYRDATLENQRKEARAIRDAHFEEVQDPMRMVAKLEINRKISPELRRGGGTHRRK